jgi:hypothetical protein
MVSPVVVDLGYGATSHTTLELAERLSSVSPSVRVIGIEIDPERVEAAQQRANSRVSFVRGGFEVPLPHDQPADVIRAFNVLRQYDESEVGDIWNRLRSRISSHGIILDGTCDEIGRVATWVALGKDGPESLTVALRPAELTAPSIAAERLVKVLIHRNVPGGSDPSVFRRPRPIVGRVSAPAGLFPKPALDRRGAGDEGRGVAGARNRSRMASR